jgi:plasmid replication initiation protein
MTIQDSLRIDFEQFDGIFIFSGSTTNISMFIQFLWAEFTSKYYSLQGEIKKADIENGSVTDYKLRFYENEDAYTQMSISKNIDDYCEEIYNNYNCYNKKEQANLNKPDRRPTESQFFLYHNQI